MEVGAWIITGSRDRSGLWWRCPLLENPADVESHRQRAETANHEQGGQETGEGDQGGAGGDERGRGDENQTADRAAGDAGRGTQESPEYSGEVGGIYQGFKWGQTWLNSSYFKEENMLLLLLLMCSFCLFLFHLKFWLKLSFPAKESRECTRLQTDF